MEYNNQSGFRHNNQYPWEFKDNEVAYLLAENGYRRDANLRPYKCWIPTLMGKVQLPVPNDFRKDIDNSIYINDIPCKPSVSKTIYTRNYIAVGAGDHDFFYHKWLDHGTKLWVKGKNDNIDELSMRMSDDPSYCDSCIIQHPSCNTVHGCIHEE